MPALYVVATPIGNLEDVTLRALSILREVKLIAAEDTRKTRRLLARYDITTPMTSYYEHNKVTKLDYILGRLAEVDVALVSEAGTPGISDPGYELVKAAGERNIPVVPVPGASAVVSALSVSGLPTDRFIFLGFLPRKAGARKKMLESVRDEPGTLILLEAPRRVTGTLKNIMETFGDRRIAVCRELTKLHEEVFRGTVSEAVDHYPEPRGEFTLVVEGKTGRDGPQLTAGIERRLDELRNSGATAREAVAKVAAETGLSRKDLYRAWLNRLDDKV
jgi:16S rRNA (cytidine1402-2'-O)-methyltransferase